MPHVQELSVILNFKSSFLIVFSQQIAKMCKILVYMVSFVLQASIIESLCNDLLATNPVRQEIVRREESGQLISGKGGEGGAYPMRTLEERKRRAEAMAKDVSNDLQLTSNLTFPLCIRRSISKSMNTSEWNEIELRAGLTRIYP